MSRSSSAQEMKPGQSISPAASWAVGRFRGRPEAKIGVAEDLPGQRLQEVEDPRLPPLVFAEGLVVHEEVDDRLLPPDPMEPVGVFGRRERVFGPVPVGEAEGHVVRKAVVPQEELQLLAARRTVHQVGAPPAEDLFGPLGEDRLVAHLFHRRREGVAVDQLRVAEGPALLPEEGTDPLPVAEDLLPELPRREEEGEGVAVGLVEELDASRSGQALKALQDIRPVPFQSGRGATPEREKATRKAPPYSSNQLKQKGAGGEIAFLRDAVQDPAVLRLVFVVMELAHVEEGVSPQTAGLVDLKVEADARHLCSFRALYGDTMLICPRIALGSCPRRSR